MKIDRACLIVYFKNRVQFLERLDRSGVSIAYVSKAQNYVVVYFDSYRMQNVKHQLSLLPGFLSVEESYAMDENYNFEILEHNREGNKEDEL
jgi:uncharacterized protein YlbG (UPF0298 family)